jgi:hypothetical protein
VQLLREGYHEKLFLFTDEQEGLVVRKQAKSERNSTLATEIAWLEELPPSLHRYFPRIIRAERANGNGRTSFYDMPYFGQDWMMLSELILAQVRDRKSVRSLITQVLRVMFEGVYPITYPEEVRAYPETLVSLFERSIQSIARMPACSSLVLSDTLLLNGEQQWNVFPLLEFIKSRKPIQDALRPAAIRKVHGDLYPENVLVYLPSLRWSVPRIILIDPIAAIGLSRGDFAMDVAKFRSWLSAELLALRLGLFSIQQSCSFPSAFTFRLHTYDGQLRSLNDGRLLSEFDHLLDTAAWAQDVCEADLHWRQRVSLYESIYALSMVPLVPPSQSLGRFLVGVQHLNVFVRSVEKVRSASANQNGTGRSAFPASYGQ